MRELARQGKPAPANDNLSQFVREMVASVPWGHHANALAKFTDPAARLRDLLIEAIRYGERPEIRARLTQAILNAVNQEQLRELLEEQSLAHDSMDAGRVARVREETERAEARRLDERQVSCVRQRVVLMEGWAGPDSRLGRAGRNPTIRN